MAGIEVAAVRVWHEALARALEVGRVAPELAGHARAWLGRVAERALEALEPAPEAWQLLRGSRRGQAA